MGRARVRRVVKPASGTKARARRSARGAAITSTIEPSNDPPLRVTLKWPVKGRWLNKYVLAVATSDRFPTIRIGTWSTFTAGRSPSEELPALLSSVLTHEFLHLLIFKLVDHDTAVSLDRLPAPWDRAMVGPLDGVYGNGMLLYTTTDTAAALALKEPKTAAERD